MAELRRAMLEEVRGLPEASNAIASAIDELRRSLPPECRDVLGRDEDETAAISARLAERGCERCSPAWPPRRTRARRSDACA